MRGMLHCIIGILAIICGIWMMLPDWMFIGEMLKMLVFLALVGFGVVAVLAGFRQLGTNR